MPLDEQLRRFGAPPAVRADFAARRARQMEAGPCCVFPCNWDAVMLLTRCGSQLIYAGINALPVAMDHNAAWRTLTAMRAAAKISDAQTDLDIFDRFLVLENSALHALQQQMKR